MTDVAARQPGPSDAELIAAVRAGSSQAYAALYERHRGAAYNLARHLARSASEADDLVADAFAKLLDMLRSGGGPDTAFRAYLLTAVRNCAYDRARRESKIELSDDVSSLDAGVPFTDTAVAGLDRTLAARAFATLPQRWQTVLWHTEIEGASPAEIAPLLGLSPNGVSALAYRAREGLRQAYLQVHLADAATAGAGSPRCQAAIAKLGAWTRHGLSKRETAQVEQHLDECARCRALAAELADVNGGLRAFVAPLVLGPAAAAYLAAAGPDTAAVTAASASGVTSGMPRPWLSLAGSVTALATALAVGVFAGSAETPAPSGQAVSSLPYPPAPSAGSQPQQPATPTPTAPQTPQIQPPELPQPPGPPGPSVPPVPTTPVKPAPGTPALYRPAAPVTPAVMAGTPQVPVEPPPPTDNVAIQASATRQLPWRAIVDVVARNTGQTTGPVTMSIMLPDDVTIEIYDSNCVQRVNRLECATRLDPGGTTTWRVRLQSLHEVRWAIPIAAALGTARATTELTLDLGMLP